MSQNVISITFTPDALAQIDGAIATLEQAFNQTGLLTLTPEQRQSLYKMGDKSETFCRLTVSLLEQNLQLIPPSLDVAEARRDLVALDALRPRLPRLARLLQQAEDSVTALGSDVNVAATKGYTLLQIAGKGEGLDEALNEISARWQRKRKKPSSET